MLNALERDTIAKYVVDYLIDHLLIEEPMSADELVRLAKDVTEDRGIADRDDFEKVTNLAVTIVSKDPRVLIRTKGEGRDRALWIYHIESSGNESQKVQ